MDGFMEVKDIHHHLNPLHIFCRLLAVMNPKQAMVVVRIYEQTIWRAIKRVLGEME